MVGKELMTNIFFHWAY